MKRALTTAATLATLLSACSDDYLHENDVKALRKATETAFAEVIYGEPIEIRTIDNDLTINICYQQPTDSLIDSIYVQRIAELPIVVRRITPDTTEQKLYWNTAPSCLVNKAVVEDANPTVKRWITPLNTEATDSTPAQKDTTPTQAYNTFTREAPKDTAPDSTQ